MQTAGEPGGRLRRSAPLTVPADGTQVGAARRFVQQWLTEVDGLSDGFVADLVLVTSELVTNAVEHGRDDEVHLVLADDGFQSTLTVTSRAAEPAFATVGDGSGWNVAEPTSLTGRGLGIVRSLVDEVAVGRTGDRLTITVTKRRPDEARSSA